jgi:hypothetical protein
LSTPAFGFVDDFADLADLADLADFLLADLVIVGF